MIVLGVSAAIAVAVVAHGPSFQFGPVVLLVLWIVHDLIRATG
jgi:hypothetical protein